MTWRRHHTILLVILLVGMHAVSAWASGPVWILRLDREIGRGSASYVRGGLSAAEEEGADLVVLSLSTPGGLLDAALVVRDHLLETRLPTIAYVDREALSAGALIAIACDEIVFAPGGVMGAATPVLFDPSGGIVEASEKTKSAVRTLFRATAEAQNRDPSIAEAMVDPSVVIPDLAEAGTLLTLTASEAETVGYAEARAEDLTALLAARGYDAGDAFFYERRAIDLAAETITSTALAAVLLVVGLIGLIIEMVVPGFGVAGLVGALCLGAFFWAHFLVGLAGWESIALLLGGLLAVILEIFVFTAADFGLAGIAGLVLVGLGFYTSMVGPLSDRGDTLQAIAIVSVGVVVALAVGVFLIARLPRSKLRFGGVILSSAIGGSAFSDPDHTGAPSATWVGRRGTAETDLRPVGVGRFGDDRIDVLSERGHVAKGTPIVIVRDDKYRKIVRRTEEE